MVLRLGVYRLALAALVAAMVWVVIVAVVVEVVTFVATTTAAMVIGRVRESFKWGGYPESTCQDQLDKGINEPSAGRERDSSVAAIPSASLLLHCL